MQTTQTATTSFSEWLEVLLDNIQDYEDLFDMEESLVKVIAIGAFNTELKGDKKLVFSDYIDQPLLLASEKAERYFLQKINKRFSESGSIAVDWQICRDMRKDD